MSHDLRTPLTLLRLRTEEVADADERDKMLATIGEMNDMIGTTLAFARDEVRAEPRRKVDIAALLATVVDDMADAGLPVTMQPAAPVVHECQPGALKRAITNLLDNAVKYGKRATAAITTTGKRSRSPSTTTGREFPRRNCREFSSRFTGSRIYATATPAERAWGSRSRNLSRRRTAANSRSQTGRAAACAPASGCLFNWWADQGLN